jgi:hypothetical protein
MQFLFLLFTLIFSTQAYALVYVEPSLGYFNGGYHFEQNFQGTIEKEKYSNHGFTYGGRAGLSWLGLQLGPEYLRNNLTIDGDSVNINEWAGILGYRFWFVRLYAGYIYKADIADSRYDSGNGPKYGFTFYMYRFMALNLEYRSVKFPTYKDPTYDLYLKNSYSGVALSMSFPFEI